MCCQNKGPKGVVGYREADLRLCFCICKIENILTCTTENEEYVGKIFL